MKNYILLAIQIAALVAVSIGAQIATSMALQIIDIVLIPINILGICGHIHNIITNVVDKRIDEHIINEHIVESVEFTEDEGAH